MRSSAIRHLQSDPVPQCINLQSDETQRLIVATSLKPNKFAPTQAGRCGLDPTDTVLSVVKKAKLPLQTTMLLLASVGLPGSLW